MVLQAAAMHGSTITPPHPARWSAKTRRTPSGYFGNPKVYGTTGTVGGLCCFGACFGSGSGTLVRVTPLLFSGYSSVPVFDDGTKFDGSEIYGTF